MEHLFLIFSGLTILSLLLMLYSDLQKMKIDQRRNYFMFGATLTIGLVGSNASTFFWAAITLMIFWMGFSQIEKMIGKVMGEGDKQVFAWLLPGLALFNIQFSVLCLAVFFILITIFSFYTAYTKTQKKYPGIIFISLAFILTLFLVV